MSLIKRYEEKGFVTITVTFGKNDKDIVEALEKFSIEDKRPITSVIRYALQNLLLKNDR